jgi:hypothetical protein
MLDPPDSEARKLQSNDDRNQRFSNDAISHLISARTTLTVSFRVLAALAHELVRPC